MKINEITLKSLSLEIDGSPVSIEQIDKCFTSANDGGIIIYKNRQYTSRDFAELLCTLNKNNAEGKIDMEDNVLVAAWDKYGAKMLQEMRESNPIEEIKQLIKNKEKR